VSFLTEHRLNLPLLRGQHLPLVDAHAEPYDQGIRVRHASDDDKEEDHEAGGSGPGRVVDAAGHDRLRGAPAVLVTPGPRAGAAAEDEGDAEHVFGSRRLRSWVAGGPALLLPPTSLRHSHTDATLIHTHAGAEAGGACLGDVDASVLPSSEVDAANVIPEHQSPAAAHGRAGGNAGGSGTLTSQFRSLGLAGHAHSTPHDGDAQSDSHSCRRPRAAHYGGNYCVRDAVTEQLEREVDDVRALYDIYNGETPKRGGREKHLWKLKTK
jgi:hypothetical protein